MEERSEHILMLFSSARREGILVLKDCKILTDVPVIVDAKP